MLGLVVLSLGAAAPLIRSGASLDEVLSALQERGKTMQDFTADVTLSRVDQATADTSSDVGKIWFEQLAGGDGRIRVTFTQETRGDKTFGEKHEYTLANGWLIDRDYKNKDEVRRQVVAPGEKISLLKLGEGPFPLPIGQDPKTVRQDFDVSLVAAAKDDVPDTVHVLLKPKAGTELARKFSTIDVWVDRQTAMPVKISSLDSAGEEVQTADLGNILLNQHLTDADFALPPVEGWDVTEEPYRP